MAVEITDVQRVDGRAVTLTAWIGDIEISYARPKGSDWSPQEVSRLRHGVQILDQDTLYIPKSDYQKLLKQVGKIFSEDRSKPFPRKKKFHSELQGKLF